LEKETNSVACTEWRDLRSYEAGFEIGLSTFLSSINFEVIENEIRADLKM
jgi:hypothetical protein